MACWYKAFVVALAVMVSEADFGRLVVRADDVGPSGNRVGQWLSQDAFKHTSA